MKKVSEKQSNSIHSKFKILTQNITNPFVMEFPYICFFMLIMGIYETLQFIHGRFVNIDNPGAYQPFLNLFGNIGIWFLWAYFIAVIINNSSKKVTKLLFYIVTLSLFAIQHFLLQNFGLKISPTCFVLLAETNRNETNEFINQYILSDAIIPTVKITLFYAVSIIIAEVVWHKLIQIIKKISFHIKFIFALFLTPTLLFGIGYSHIYWKIYNAKSPDEIRFMAPPNDPISSIFTSIITIRMMSENMENAIKTTKSINTNSTFCVQEDPLNLIVVIGESYIKWHSQLYEYYLNTTPHLAKEEKEGRLFVFNDVISSSNSTSVVMRNILSCNNSSEGEFWYNYPFFPAIFKQSGYNVYFWDNQLDCDPTATYSFTLNSFLYDPEIRKTSYTMTNDRSYNLDGDLIDSFAKTIDIPSNMNNLILFHLMGQHHMATDRFPQKEFKHFNADSIKRNDPYLNKSRKEYIADYDNATLYNDYVLKKIIELFSNTNSVIIYLSDHGEEVHDYRIQNSRDHGPLTSNKLKFQYEIPFMIWCSDIYKERYPNTIEKIKKALNYPLISDNLCNLLFNIGGINTPYYRESLDIISPNYQCKKRFIDQDFCYENIRYNGI